YIQSNPFPPSLSLSLTVHNTKVRVFILT
uniref:Uncharacterized protein n=2 Tax=Amphimedon queenslandica TaxID=400682 RepID=A0A1X7SDJ8_AMPQE